MADPRRTLQFDSDRTLNLSAGVPLMRFRVIADVLEHGGGWMTGRVSGSGRWVGGIRPGTVRGVDRMPWGSELRWPSGRSSDTAGVRATAPGAAGSSVRGAWTHDPGGAGVAAFIHRRCGQRSASVDDAPKGVWTRSASPEHVPSGAATR
jgi:hypothetical protein